MVEDAIFEYQQFRDFYKLIETNSLKNLDRDYGTSLFWSVSFVTVESRSMGIECYIECIFDPGGLDFIPEANYPIFEPEDSPIMVAHSMNNFRHENIRMFLVDRTDISDHRFESPFYSFRLPYSSWKEVENRDSLVESSYCRVYVDKILLSKILLEKAGIDEMAYFSENALNTYLCKFNDQLALRIYPKENPNDDLPF